jgi:hypothetical protein
MVDHLLMGSFCYIIYLVGFVDRIEYNVLDNLCFQSP